MSETMYWAGLAQIPSLQGQKGWQLINHFGSARGVWEASQEDLLEARVLTPKAIEGFARVRSSLQPDRDLARWREAGISFITSQDESYPNPLKNIFDPPLALFCRGEILAQDEKAIAVVGSRRCSVYGRKTAEKIAGELAEAGVTVVSGLARGIDTAAHRGALEKNGRTIAVLGCGVDIVYPAENRKYYDQIPERGAIVSEFAPGTPGEAWHFPLRNRIISGLSRGVLVVEAAEKSGTLITVDCALEQGRDVFAVPGNISSPLSKGTHRLIKQGAVLTEDAGDILQEMGLERPAPNTAGTAQTNLTPPEKKIIAHLSTEPVSMENLALKAGLHSGEMASAMVMLELKGLVYQLPGQRYIKAFEE